jgi:hypothetical protein
MFNLNAPTLGRTIVNDRIRTAEQRRRFTVAERHERQRERVRASLVLKPEPRSAGRR